jgi:hypothetical protein
MQATGLAGSVTVCGVVVVIGKKAFYWGKPAGEAADVPTDEIEI